MNTFSQIFQTITMLCQAVQKLIQATDDVASMVQSATDTALKSQQAQNKADLAALELSLNPTEQPVLETKE